MLRSSIATMLIVFSSATAADTPPAHRDACMTFEDLAAKWLTEPMLEELLGVDVEPMQQGNGVDIFMARGLNDDQQRVRSIASRAMRLSEALLPRFQKWGFDLKRVHLVVESSPGQIKKVKINDTTGEIVWQEVLTGPRQVGRTSRRDKTWILTFPCGEEISKLTIGDKTIVVMTAHSGYHTLELPNTLAHELAHSTQRGRHTSVLWLEARADLVAYLTTNETKIWHHKTDSIIRQNQINRLNGVERPNGLIRDLESPLIRHTSMLAANATKGSHANSELASHLLYLMSKKFGKARLAEFIHWMDDYSGFLELRLMNKIGEESPEQTRERIRLVQFKRLALLLDDWSVTSARDANLRAWLRLNCEDLGFIKPEEWIPVEESQ